MWIDHNRFADLRTRDDTQPVYFGHRYQVHDGLLDITNESDFVTVSWNQFTSHDKTMLIGNSDSAPEDREHLRVTLHHNLFDGVGQRTPRVRYGKVHVYNNVYRADKNTNYRSSWGAGTESQIYAENNYFEMSAIFGPMEVIDGKKGTRITVVRQLLEGKGSLRADGFPGGCTTRASIRTLQPDAGWTPSLYGSAKAAEPAEISTRTGAERKWPRTGLQQQKLTDVREMGVGRGAATSLAPRPIALKLSKAPSISSRCRGPCPPGISAR